MTISDLALLTALSDLDTFIFHAEIVEGFNSNAKLIMRRSYGFKSFRTVGIELYHALGDPPEPKTTHRL
ncbi:transposase [bacterium]|nr:transposase [bacterium]